MNKQGKITLGALIGTAVVCIPISAVMIVKETNNKEKVLNDSSSSDILLQKGMMYNFDHPELVEQKTSTLAREVLRITLNTMHGVGDFSGSFFAKDFTTPSFVSIKDILELLKKPEMTDELFNQLIVDLKDITFYQAYGYEIKKSAFTSLTLSNASLSNYLKTLNKDFIFEDTLHEVDGYSDIYNGNISDFNIYDNNVFQKLHDYTLQINDAEATLNKLNGKKVWINYKIPSQFLLHIDKPNDSFKSAVDTSDTNSVNVVAHYDKYDYLKNINSLMSLLPFNQRHRMNTTLAPEVPYLYRFQQYDKFYTPLFNVPFTKQSEHIPGRSYYNIHNNGQMWERNVVTSDLLTNMDEDNMSQFNKSHVPLNKQLFFDKLHNSQTNKFGLAPTRGSYFGFNDGAYEMDHAFQKGLTPTQKELKKKGILFFNQAYPEETINWNYMNKLIFWNTVSNKSMAIPRASDIDKAHINGVKVYASYFPSTIADLNTLLFEDYDHQMLAINSLVKIAKRVGFDGYFMNMEMARNMANWKDYYYRKKFFKRLATFKRIAKDNGIEFIWYGHLRGHHLNPKEYYDPFYTAASLDVKELLTDDALAYQFNYDENFQPMLDDASIPGTEAYINPYVNFQEHVSPEDYWDLLGYFWYVRKKFDLKNYAGTLWQIWLSNAKVKNNWSWVLNNIYEIQQYIIGFGNTPHQEWWGDINVYGEEMYRLDGNNNPLAPYLDKVQKYGFECSELLPASGVNGDPRDTTTSAYSKYIQERSVIDGTKSFRTYFNIYSSYDYYKKGELWTNNGQSISPWGASFISDIYPTYRWITDVYDLHDNPVMWTQRHDFNKEIKTRFKLTDAYNGSNTIGFSGNLPSNNKLENKLYGATIDNANTKNWDITFRGPITPKLLTWDNGGAKTAVAAANVITLVNGWKKAIYNISSGTTKYFGYSLENTTSSPIDLNNEYINGISWNRVGDDLITHNSNLDSLHPTADQYYDSVNNKFYFNVNLNITYQRDVYYETYRLENGKEILVGWNSAGFFRDGINSTSSSGTQSYKIISRNHNNDIIGEETVNILYKNKLS